jgi:SAM-dependent methyltransferase
VYTESSGENLYWNVFDVLTTAMYQGSHPAPESLASVRRWPLSARILRQLSRSPQAEDYPGGTQLHTGENALDFILKTVPGFHEMISGRTVLDYGCGLGHQALAIKAAGAAHVTGYDPFPKFPSDAPPGIILRSELPEGKFDVVLNSSSLEHFANPELEFVRMRDFTRERLVITWAEPWYSHSGSHMSFFTRVPWVNLLFPERSIFLVRSLYRQDGATRYEESSLGGALNRMTVARFEQIVQTHKREMTVDFARNYATRGLPLVTRIPVLRELLTSACTCVLRAPAGARV